MQQQKTKTLKDILKDAKVVILVDYKGFKNGNHNWSVYLRKTDDSFWLPFKTEFEERPSESEIMESIYKYDPGTFEDFCEVNNYSTDSRNAKKEYNEKRRQYSNMSRIFSEQHLQELRELNY